jgi:DNA-directed RNA polymerase, mitochondrial
VQAGPTYFASTDSAKDIVDAELCSPEIRPHPQRGYGRKALETALSSFAQNHFEDDVPKEWDEKTVRQYRLEKDTNKGAVEKWHVDHDTMRHRGEADRRLSRGVLGGLMWKWHSDLTPQIRSALEELAAGKGGLHRQTSEEVLAPFLQRISASKIAATTILTVIRAMVRKTIQPIIHAVTDVGTAVQNETTIELLKHRNRDVFTHMGLRRRRKLLGRLLTDERRQASEAERLTGIVPSGEKEWTTATKIRIGSLLVSLLLKTAKIDVPSSWGVAAAARAEVETFESHSALQKKMIVRKGNRQAILKMHPYFHFLLRRDPPPALISKHLPMLTPPVPWSGYRHGGYITQPVSVVRTTTQHANTKEYVKLAIEKGDMDQIFAALDVLGRTGWRINKPVFEAMANVWNTGDGFGKIPPAQPDLPYPPAPEDPNDVRARQTYSLECRQVDDRREGMHSNRCFMNLQLEVARSFLHDTFYFPHNLDFRGRSYPIPPYLNHMGADHCRGLLQFAKGRELGKSGLWWLRVHLANVFGYDKASFEERHNFALDHMEEIRDSAKRPLDGTRWWTQAEDRWQCLATCIELTNAMELSDPTKFVSYLPIHQDGTCNGLQHYAALGGDAVGAMQVNLEPGERPADLYTAVANKVQESIQKDAAAGHSLAQVLDGKIKRKIVKQTVMTNVYGVTLAGAKAQIHRQIEDHYPDMLTGVLHGKFLASSYIAHKVFEALASMFTGAHHIQYWLAECASRIAGSVNPQQVEYVEGNIQPGGALPSAGKRKTYRGEETKRSQKLPALEARSRSTVIWTTPLRMPVVQPYRKTLARTVKTNLTTLSVNDASPADPVQKKKQVQAFPPNFIHSLDATHMMLTALRCDELGLSFASVHDSFWTHASDVNTMNRVIRDSFIRMHSDDIVGRLAAEFKVRYGGSMYLMSIPRYSSIGKKIAMLPGSGKRGKIHGSAAGRYAPLLEDLVLERKRLRLLNSEDPAEQEEGKAMVTPASVFEELGGQKQAYIPKLDAAIGDVPNPMFAEREAFLKEILASANDEGELTEHDESEHDDDALHVGDDVHVENEAFSATDEITAQTQAKKSLHIPELDGELSPEEQEKRKKEARTRRNALWRWHRKINIWLPLEFPPVPKRGDYDVRRIDASPYFFS